MAKKRPFITVKIAQTLDGKIAAAGGKSRWITGPKARQFVHELRSEHDAVLVGKNTFTLDKPRLASLKNNNPVWKIILASPDMLPIRNSRIFEDGAQVVFVTAPSALKKFIAHASLRYKPCYFLPVSRSKDGFDLNALMAKLSAMGIKKILVEGGGEVFWSFLKNNLADKVYWLIAPKILGGRTAKTSVEGEGLKDPNRALPFRITRVRKLGQDLCLEGRLS